MFYQVDWKGFERRRGTDVCLRAGRGGSTSLDEPVPWDLGGTWCIVTRPRQGRPRGCRVRASEEGFKGVQEELVVLGRWVHF